jgi:glycosyltransferase involved in cell wall biosynthesis
MALQILDYPWHQVHSYRLHALPAKFTHLMTRPLLWNVAQRPVPDNWTGGIQIEDCDPHDYDVALLHLDQWCDGRHNLRAMPYRIMKQIAQDIPRIVIMHGTPEGEENREAILRLIGDLPVICNSPQAAAIWDGGDEREDCHGLPQFRAIIHGYRVDEFSSEPLEKRRREAITICSGGSWSREYHGISLLERLMRDIPLAWYGPQGNRDWLDNYDDYRAMLASSLIYFSPTRRAPMPGARTEAMLSGCCIVSVPGNGFEDLVAHGATAFIAHTYVEARDALALLLRQPEVAYQVGQQGREAARELFAHGRFVEDWLATLGEIGVSVH